MKLQIIKIFSFWIVICFLIHAVVENSPTRSSDISNIQLTKPAVTKVKRAKKLSLGHYSALKGKRIAMK